MTLDSALESRRRFDGHLRRTRRIERATYWMRHIPFVGRVAFVFWFTLLDEGPRATLKPRWGAMTFSFLNDGMRPTLWHTWRQMAHHDEEYAGIWVGGAPKNRADAEAKLAAESAKWESE